MGTVATTKTTTAMIETAADAEQRRCGASTSPLHAKVPKQKYPSKSTQAKVPKIRHGRRMQKFCRRTC
eukprot:2466160-Pleurochrysis_carterae.AAC.2